MGQLVHVTQGALTGEEITVRNLQQRQTLSDGLRLLKQHAPALIKGYPVALLDAFADGSADAPAPPRPADPVAFDFGELSLMDDAQVLAQVERSRAQQIAAHTTDAALAELNTLVSAAQGLPSVQPERNPLRPDNYIRALQQVFDQTDVPAPVRELWMRHMRELLAQQLVGTYQRAAQALRCQGVVPVGYAVLSPGGRNSSHAPIGAFGAGIPASARVPLGGMGAQGGDSGEVPLDDDAQEALLTVGILRQMLDAQGIWAGLPLLPPGAVAASRRGGLPPAAPVSQTTMAAEAMEDIAALEQLVGELVATAERGSPAAAPQPSAEALQAAAEDVVRRMVQTLVDDARLLPPVQRAVQQLEPALLQLVRVDPRFFDDAQHPARRLLDQVTERSMAFASADGPGFARFMRLVNGAVRHLSGVSLQDAQPFDNVLKTLESAWNVQAQEEERSRREATERAQALAAKHAARLARLAAEACALPGADAVPVDVLDFATGPWVRVLAQLPEPDSAAELDPEGYRTLLPVLLRLAQPVQDAAELARMAPLVPALLGTVRAGLESINHPEDRIAAVLERIADLHHAACEQIEGVRDDEDDAPDGDVEGVFPPRAAFAMSFGMADDEAHARALLEEAEAAALTAAAVAAAAAAAEPDPLPLIEPQPARSPVLVAPPAMPALLDLPVIDGSALDQGDPDFPIGAWVELSTNHRQVQTQLTWASPSGALFLFTAADGSTQSMTRRMRDKLLADGALRVLPGTVR